ncbi:MAG: RDD family protein [Acholeplasmatales bacterium]|nr:RDD family protein [Acholeplasmatales bacterium]
MKLYLKAPLYKRFLAFLIDGVIVVGLSILIGFLILWLMKFDFQRYGTLSDKVYKTYYDFMITGNGALLDDAFYKDATEFFRLGLVRLGIIYAVAIVLTIPYLVVLPYFWKGRTLGRFAMRLTIISHIPNTSLKLHHIVRREILGSYLLLGVFSYIIALPSLFILLFIGRSITDLVSSTDLVLEDPVIVDENTQGFYNFFNNRMRENNYYQGNNNDKYDDNNSDIIDAEVNDVKDENNNLNDNKIDDKKNESFDDDDEYEVF